MKFSTTAFLAAAITGTAIQSVQAAHTMACTVSRDGQGAHDRPSSHDCCLAQPSTVLATWIEDYTHCGNDHIGGNGLDQGAFTDCCTSKNKGTTAT